VKQNTIHALKIVSVNQIDDRISYLRDETEPAIDTTIDSMRYLTFVEFEVNIISFCFLGGCNAAVESDLPASGHPGAALGSQASLIRFLVHDPWRRCNSIESLGGPVNCVPSTRPGAGPTQCRQLYVSPCLP
jgi:hypothetical protein